MISIKYAELITTEVVKQNFVDACTRNGMCYLEEMLEFPCMRARQPKAEVTHFEGKYAGFVSAYEQRRRADAMQAFGGVFHIDKEDTAADVVPAFLRKQM
jgi:hypothetical protein